MPLPEHAGTWSGLFALYRERFDCRADDLHVVAHLGQSLDGKIATANGQSRYVTGPDDLAHMHRLRALADAVVVGAGTVVHDDPQLTVRLCDGPSPVRVVIDPDRRLQPSHRAFQDEAARTILLTKMANLGNGRHGHATVLAIETDGNKGYRPTSVLEVLAAQGLCHLLVEGGGATVARFWQAGCLDRLDLCVAPVVIGQGRDALPLPSVRTMDDAERFEPEIIPLGRDRLYVLRRDRISPDRWQEQEVGVTDPHTLGRGVSLSTP